MTSYTKTMSEHRRNHLIKPKILCSLDQLFVINSVLPTHLKTSFHNLKSFHPPNPRPMANAQTYTMVTKSQNFTHQIEPDSPLDWHCLCVLIIVWFCICLFHFLWEKFDFDVNIKARFPTKLWGFKLPFTSSEEGLFMVFFEELLSEKLSPNWP